ncbi:OLC1v1016244C1 [Oldenlandia corymbosa var. corymbosa]|uniref:OLC1v1016244C1 n=1 Tax=Oldenlandia corymbosa var. corymbosa TaxID=529605 RepID=A0AAV1E6U7_OLDCO|nr:OLC1v1016244C1 [Oldenlandia corymbosa var. corymbosa]
MTKAKSETESQPLISRLGNRLSTYKTCPGKEPLVELLEQAGSALGGLKQRESENQVVVRPFRDFLIKYKLFQHKDKDIRLLVATCVCEIIRAEAPDPSFTDEVLRDIFTLLLSIFGETVDITSPYFSRRVKLLDTVAKLKFCVLMLDSGCEDLVLEMFKIFFGVAREQHPQCVINAMAFIVTHILDEKLEEEDHEPLVFQEKVSEPLLDVIFQNLVREPKDAAVGSERLAVSVIQNCTEKFKRYICTFFRSCILNPDIIESKTKESYHEIIYEIFRIAPQMLLSVIPSFSHELLTDQVDVRIKALNLLKKLFSLPGHRNGREYYSIFAEFITRFSDKSSEVRLCALSCAKAFCMSDLSGTESVEVFTAIQSRLLDFDDRVRTQAVTLLCDLGRSKINSISGEVICLVAERLRDKKVSVRKKALQKLLELYRDYCTKCAEDMAVISDHFEQIPGKILMLLFDKEFRLQSLEHVLAVELFPDSLSVEDKMRHWIYLCSFFTPLHLKALNIILSQKRRLRDALQSFLYLWSREKDINYEEIERKTKALVLKISAYFPNPEEAKDLLYKLTELKDDDIFRMLRELLLNVQDAHSVRDHLLIKVGSHSHFFEFLKLLSAKCMLNIFSSRHIRCILDQLTVGDCVGYKHLKDSSVRLLLTVLGAFPMLLQSSEKRFLELLAKDIIPFNEQVIHVMTKDGSNLCIELSDVYALLEKVCLEGTRAHAKLAVIAIKALSGSREKVIFSKLCKILLDSLRHSKNVPTVLQSLGCIAQQSPSALEAHEADITSYILEEVFTLAKVDKSNKLNSNCETSQCCKSCMLQIYGLKALVKSFLPTGHSPGDQNFNYLLSVITKMLQTGCVSDVTDPCHSDMGSIQLAAAKSVLLLSRKWDLHISPLIFRMTMLVATDNSLLLRRLFVNKVQKLLKEHAVPSRYACAFSFASSDADKTLYDDSLKYMGEYIKLNAKRAGLDESAPLSRCLLKHPVYVIVFLIHLLAHDSGFPPMDCLDAEMYQKPVSILHFCIRALLNIHFYDKDSEVEKTAFYLRSIFIAIKRAEDAVDAQKTPKLHFLADMGISLLHHAGGKVPKADNPELILLPSSLYKLSLPGSREGYSTFSSHNESGATLIEKLTGMIGSRTSQDSSTTEKRGKIISKEDFLITETNCMNEIASRAKIIERSNKPCSYQKQLHEASPLGTEADGKSLAVSFPPPKTFENSEFLIGDEDIENFEAVSNEQFPSSHNSVATKCTLVQKDVLCGHSTEMDMLARCNSRPGKSKLETANYYKLRNSKEIKDKVDRLDVEHLEPVTTNKSHAEQSCVSNQMETSNLLLHDYNTKSIKTNKFCSNRIPLRENVERVQKSKSAARTANEKENIGRTTRRRLI